MQSFSYYPWTLPPGSLADMKPNLSPAWSHLTLSPGPPFVPGWPGTPWRKKLISVSPPALGSPRHLLLYLPPPIQIPSLLQPWPVGAKQQKAQPWHHKLDRALSPVYAGASSLWGEEEHPALTGTRDMGTWSAPGVISSFDLNTPSREGGGLPRTGLPEGV